jgi:CheY-like chemotaxis protein
MNLGTNAIKYNRHGGRVTLQARWTGGDMVEVAVIDTGIGIPRELHAEVFQPFNRLGAEQRAIEGTGIGLAISHRLASLMQGQLSFESEPDHGSTFWIELPTAGPPERVAAEMEAEQRSGEVAGLDPAHKPLTLLYVEDNPPNIALMQDLVDSVPNLRLLTAPNGNTGLALAHAHRPDLIVLDINLPGLNGFEVLKRLKYAQRTRDIPVMALTAAAKANDVERGKAAGFTHYLTKPINVQEFLGALRDNLERSRNAS